MSAPYPWLAEPWAELTGRAARDNLGHAYLLCGREGLGKYALAEAFARGLLCETRPPDGQACGTDRKSTRLNSSHPRLSRMPSSA